MSLADGFYEPHLTTLPDGVRAETYTYSNGKTSTVYKAPMAEDGPVFSADHLGNKYLLYMYAHWVFVWSQGSSVLDIRHGTLKESHLMHKSVKINADRFDAERLSTFGKRWYRKTMQGYSKQP